MKVLFIALLVAGFGTANAQQIVPDENAGTRAAAPAIPLEALVGFTMTGVIEAAEILPGTRGDTCTVKFLSVADAGATVEVGGFGFSGEFTLTPEGASTGKVQSTGVPGRVYDRKLSMSQNQGGFSYRLVDMDGNIDLICLGAKPGVY